VVKVKVTTFKKY